MIPLRASALKPRHETGPEATTTSWGAVPGILDVLGRPACACPSPAWA